MYQLSAGIKQIINVSIKYSMLLGFAFFIYMYVHSLKILKINVCI